MIPHLFSQFLFLMSGKGRYCLSGCSFYLVVSYLIHNFQIFLQIVNPVYTPGTIFLTHIDLEDKSICKDTVIYLNAYHCVGMTGIHILHIQYLRMGNVQSVCHSTADIFTGFGPICPATTASG